MFNPILYKTIFDGILTNKQLTPRIIANTYLHILNAHPEFLAKYDASKKQKNYLSIKYKLITLARFYQSIFDARFYYAKQNSKQYDVLFVSHLTNNQQLSQNEDIYFGNLAEQLSKNNITSSTALINHTKINYTQAISNQKNSIINKWILSPSLNFLSEVNLYLSQKKSQKLLKKYLSTQSLNTDIEKQILQHHLSSDTINAIRIAKQVARLIQKTQAKYIITSYEGHAWERLVYYYARKSNPNIKCIAYQHAAVFEHQHALKRLLHDDYNPDIILTSGMIAQNTLKQCDGLKSIDISCLGSPKHQKPHKLATITQHCLVVPDGFISECLLLFELSLSYAKNNPKQCFIWRLHPLLSFKKLKKHSVLFNDLSDNITLSQQTLEQDIEQCDSVLYRGSTAVVNAINSGLTPIYYQQFNDELSIDPIYQQKAGKFIVKNQDELQKALTQNIDTDTQQKRQNFAQQFYTPLQAEVLINLIKSNENKQ